MKFKFKNGRASQTLDFSQAQCWEMICYRLENKLGFTPHSTSCLQGWHNKKKLRFDDVLENDVEVVVARVPCTKRHIPLQILEQEFHDRAVVALHTTPNLSEEEKLDLIMQQSMTLSRKRNSRSKQVLKPNYQCHYCGVVGQHFRWPSELGCRKRIRCEGT